MSGDDDRFDVHPSIPKRRKSTKVIKPSKDRLMPTLVNRCLNHPDGANRWHRLYDPALCEFVPDLFKNGESDAEVAVAIGISKHTFYDWINEHPEFKRAVQCGRSQAECIFQIAGREASLGQRDINSRVWEINMRNRYDFDQSKDKSNDVNDTEKEANILKATTEKLTGKLSEY
jgi:hypothetical protein